MNSLKLVPSVVDVDFGQGRFLECLGHGRNLLLGWDSRVVYISHREKQKLFFIKVRVYNLRNTKMVFYFRIFSCCNQVAANERQQKAKPNREIMVTKARRLCRPAISSVISNVRARRDKTSRNDSSLRDSCGRPPLWQKKETTIVFKRKGYTSTVANVTRLYVTFHYSKQSVWINTVEH